MLYRCNVNGEPTLLCKDHRETIGVSGLFVTGGDWRCKICTVAYGMANPPVPSQFVKSVLDSLERVPENTLEWKAPVAGPKEQEKARAYAMVDWLVRRVAPRALRIRGRPRIASRMAMMPRITDYKGANTAQHNMEHWNTPRAEHSGQFRVNPCLRDIFDVITNASYSNYPYVYSGLDMARAINTFPDDSSKVALIAEVVCRVAST